MDIRSNAFRRLPRDEQQRLLTKWRRERDEQDRRRFNAIAKRPVDLVPRLVKKDGAIV
jgi:hypothetical protein